MTGYNIVNLKLMIDAIGEDHTKLVLSDFSCPLNEDVEQFLRVKAIEFSKQNLARTHIVMMSYKQVPRIVGYFALANKNIIVDTRKVSSAVRRRVNRFGQYNADIKRHIVTAPLIAQLGKNYKDGLNSLITGDELLKMACDKLRQVQMDIGGGFVYLECEDKPELIKFYNSNGFVEFDKRKLDKDETGLSGEYLIQLLKYIGKT